MLKYYIKTREALLRLRTDKDGVVSFEYVIVAACIVGAVIAVFGTGTAGGIHDALDGVLQKIITKMGTITL
jgi:pilus assembly protein Flp/PilA